VSIQGWQQEIGMAQTLRTSDQSEVLKRTQTTPRTFVPNSFLDGLRLDHGPIRQIGQFLLTADQHIRGLGITLEFLPISTIVAVNSANQSSWGSFAPMLDTRNADLGVDNSYCLAGRGANGEIVVTQAGRIYPFSTRSLKAMADDQSLYFGEGRAPQSDQPRCILDAPAAEKITGCMVYSGALWVHPEFRGHRLAEILPRISRAYALGRWNTDYTFAFVSDRLLNSPLFGMYGYKNVTKGYSIWLRDEKIYEGSLMWMDRNELVRDMMLFCNANFAAKID
jgi:hypothetical protein